jgi:phosphomannomutase/phosphoglucomutase
MGCQVITLNGIPDGTFPGRLPEPSPAGLKGLSELVLSSGSSFGVAHDGDADRAVFIDENGKFVEENAEFSLVAQFLCNTKKGVVVTPVSSSQMGEIVVKDAGCTISYTPVGSIYVARTMRALMEKGNEVVFGGEGNGGLIFPDHQFCRDGGMTAAMMVYILATTGQKISTLVSALPKRCIIKGKMSSTRGSQVLDHLKKIYSQYPMELTDGVKIFKGHIWALVRTSGTEPIIRIIVDSDNEDTGRVFYNELMDHISKITSA